MTVFFLLLLSWASPPDPSMLEIDGEPDPQAIYGGEPVEPGSWPEVVHLVTTGKRCSGTLVAPDLVLTAAHCFEGLLANAPMLIQFGDSDATPVMQFNSSDWGRHDDFCLPADCGEDLHDVGWVRLPQSVDIPPILPITDQSEFDEVMVPGTELVFVGYGLTEDKELGIKREVVAELTGFTESGREFYAGGNGKDTCAGDSGGPALVRLSSGEIRIAGVLSRGGECGTGGTYSVPAPELCWLRDTSGLDLLPADCGCDCVSLHRAVLDDGCACAVAAPRSHVVMTFGLLAVGLFGRRRRC